MGGACWKHGETGLLDEEKANGKRLVSVGYANEVWEGQDVIALDLLFISIGGRLLHFCIKPPRKMGT